MAGNKDCKSDKHVYHLCALKACGLGGEGNGVFKKLIDNPQFRCTICEDCANKAENLCSPKKIHTQTS